MLALFLACLLHLGAPVQAGERAGPAPATDALRERLQRLSPEGRRSLARNLEQFQRLEPRTRTKLLERAQILRERQRAFGLVTGSEPGASGAQKGGDAALQEATRRWRAWLRERGHEVGERLPKHVLQRLEQARPELRRRYFERLPKHERMRALRELYALRTSSPR